MRSSGKKETGSRGIRTKFADMIRPKTALLGNFCSEISKKLPIFRKRRYNIRNKEITYMKEGG